MTRAFRNRTKASSLAKIMQKLNPEERAFVRRILDVGGRGSDGWSFILTPSTGNPHNIRLLHRDGAGVPLVMITVRDRAPAPLDLIGIVPRGPGWVTLAEIAE